MKKIQIKSEPGLPVESSSNNAIIRAAGVRRIHSGWYTVHYDGNGLDCSTVISARRNPNGDFNANAN